MYIISTLLLLYCFYVNAVYVSVFEYSPVYLLNQNVTVREARAVMMKNVDAFERATVAAAKSGSKIIVFPEDGLYGALFETKRSVFPYLEPIPYAGGGVKRFNPCLNKQLRQSCPVLSRLSCIARSHEVAMVVNMGTLASNGSQFNTAVGLLPDGTLAATYFKTHLYFEPQFDAGPGSPSFFDVPIDESSFMRVGLLVCFDIMFQSPQLELLSNNIDVDVLALPNWWVNFPPLITAVQTWGGWTLSSSAALLAAASGSSWRTSGSGIFFNGTALAYHVFTGPAGSSPPTLLTAWLDLTKRNRASTVGPAVRAVPTNDAHDNANVGSFTVVDTSTLSLRRPTIVSSSHNGLHCAATILAPPTARVELVVLQSFRGMYHGLFKASICALYPCYGSTISSCEQEFLYPNFHALNQTGLYVRDARVSAFPVTLTPTGFLRLASTVNGQYVEPSFGSNNGSSQFVALQRTELLNLALFQSQ